MGTCNKKDGTEVTVLRNSTTLVMHMKVYDESIQQGECMFLVESPRCWGQAQSPRVSALATAPSPTPALTLPSLRASWDQPLQHE